MTRVRTPDAINSDSQERRSFVAPLLAAGYGERSASEDLDIALFAGYT